MNFKTAASLLAFNDVVDLLSSQFSGVYCEDADIKPNYMS